MPYQLSYVNIQLPAWIFIAFIKSCSIDSRNEQSPTCEVVHETNKAHFRNLLPNRFLPSSVGKALAWRSGGPVFQSILGAIFDEIYFALPCVKICQIIWQKRLSLKTQMSQKGTTPTDQYPTTFIWFSLFFCVPPDIGFIKENFHVNIVRSLCEIIAIFHLFLTTYILILIFWKLVW